MLALLLLKGEYIRGLIEAERARSREEDEIAMFNEAARKLTDRDREDRETLIEAFANRD